MLYSSELLDTPMPVLVSSISVLVSCPDSHKSSVLSFVDVHFASTEAEGGAHDSKR